MINYASKLSRLTSWIVSYAIIFSLSFAIYFILFSGIKIAWELEYKVLFFGILTIILVITNFLVFPYFCKGYTVGGYFLKIKINHQKITFKKLFILSWSTSLIPITLALVFIVVRNFGITNFIFLYIMYILVAGFYILSVFVSVSFFILKETVNINEKNSGLTLVSTKIEDELSKDEHVVQVLSKHSIFDKNDEIDDILKKDE